MRAFSEKLTARHFSSNAKGTIAATTHHAEFGSSLLDKLQQRGGCGGMLRCRWSFFLSGQQPTSNPIPILICPRHALKLEKKVLERESCFRTLDQEYIIR